MSLELSYVGVALCAVILLLSLRYLRINSKKIQSIEMSLPNGYQIRECVDSDLPAIEEMCENVYDGADYLKMRFTEYLECEHTFVYGVEYLKIRQIVSTALVDVQDGGMKATLKGNRTHKNHRKKGLNSYLQQYAMAEVQKLFPNLKVFEATTVTQNIASIKSQNKNGLKVLRSIKYSLIPKESTHKLHSYFGLTKLDNYECKSYNEVTSIEEIVDILGNKYKKNHVWFDWIVHKIDVSNDEITKSVIRSLKKEQKKQRLQCIISADERFLCLINPMAPPVLQLHFYCEDNRKVNAEEILSMIKYVYYEWKSGKNELYKTKKWVRVFIKDEVTKYNSGLRAAFVYCGARESLLLSNDENYYEPKKAGLPNEYSIRECVESDLPAIEEMCANVYDGADYLQHQFIEYIKDEHTFVYGVEYKPTKKIVSIVLIIVQDGGKKATFKGNRTSEHHRKKRLNTLLQEYAMKEVQKMIPSLKIFEATTMIINTASIKSQNKNGLNVVEDIRYFMVLKNESTRQRLESILNDFDDEEYNSYKEIQSIEEIVDILGNKYGKNHVWFDWMVHKIDLSNDEITKSVIRSLKKEQKLERLQCIISADERFLCLINPMAAPAMQLHFYCKDNHNVDAKKVMAMIKYVFNEWKNGTNELYKTKKWFRILIDIEVMQNNDELHKALYENHTDVSNDYQSFNGQALLLTTADANYYK